MRVKNDPDFLSVYLARAHNIGAGGVNCKGTVTIEGVSFNRYKQLVNRTERAVGRPPRYEL